MLSAGLALGARAGFEHVRTEMPSAFVRLVVRAAWNLYNIAHALELQGGIRLSQHPCARATVNRFALRVIAHHCRSQPTPKALEWI